MPSVVARPQLFDQMFFLSAVTMFRVAIAPSASG